ncbi:UNVERIFIED_CONTAM: acyl-CoA reductase-like NAD-dependent aldehyde dehydrogenase [Brevibacillus sp. OAP136]
MKTEKMFIGGKWVDSVSSTYMSSVNPATGQQIASIPEGVREDAQLAIRAARQGFEQISRMSIWDRSKLLVSIAQVITRRREELARVLTMEQGKPYYSEALDEIDGTAMAFADAAEQIKWMETSVIPVQDPNKRVLTIHQPKGVYAVITPWNFPFMVAAEYLAPGLAAGNAIVWVPAPTTSLCAIRLAECLEEAGVPDGVLNLVTGKGSVVGDEIVANPGTVAIGFTGSTATGHQIAVRGVGKPMLLELGGNGPTIVLKDADVDHAARMIASGCFYNAGQVCSATERILAHRDVHDELVAKLVNHAKELILGDPFDPRTTMGPLNNEPVTWKNELHAKDCLEKGAKILIGGKRAANQSSDLFFEPTVIVGVTENCLYNKEETFGPVAPVMSFSTHAEALEIAARNEWGLVSSVFTSNVKDAMYFAENIKTGIVNINDSSNYWESHVPFGGVAGKASGVGRIGGKYSIREMSDLKTIALDLR